MSGLHPSAPALTILVKEEEEEGVCDGNENTTPERDAMGQESRDVSQVGGALGWAVSLTGVQMGPGSTLQVVTVQLRAG